MPEIIAAILQKVEVIMDKYGFWKVAFLILLVILAWKSPELITALKT